MNSKEPFRYFFSLDAMRGIAALIVVVLHEDQGFAGLPHPGSGYLAVDLFFLLSGFVIANAYDKRLTAGMGPWSFLKIRLIRLYPLYFLGFMIGLVRVLVQFKTGNAPPPAASFAVGAILECFVLPNPMTIGWSFDTPFLLNPPAWSLFYELGINLVYALLHPFLQRRVLYGLTVLTGAFLIWMACHEGSLEVGNLWHTMPFSLPRVAFPFLLGVCLHRAHPKMPNTGNTGTWFALMIVILVLSITPGENWRVMYDLTMAMVVFPLLVLMCSASAASGFTKHVASTMGEVSYAIYIIHMPVLGLVLGLLRRVAPDWHALPLSGPVFISLVAIACLAVDRFYDKPVRRRLTNYMKPGAQQVQAPA